MKEDWRYSNLAILVAKYRKFPSEIRVKPFGERIFMMAALRYMNHLEEEALKKK